MLFRLRLRWLGVAVVIVGCGGEGDDDAPVGADAGADAALDAGVGLDAAAEEPDAAEPLAPIDPVLVSESGESDRESEPNVVVTATGRVVVAWIALGETGRALHIGTRISDDLGETFAPVQAIESPDDRQSADPVLAALDDGTVFLVWEGFYPAAFGELPEDALMYVARLAPDATAFGSPTLVSSAEPVFNDKPWVAITPGGALLTTWVFERDGLITALVARSEDGETWDVSTLDDRPVFHELFAPCAASEGDRLYITYFGQFGIGLRSSDDDGRTWPGETDTLVSRGIDGVVGFDDPRCVARGDDVWVSYGPAEEQWTASTPALLRRVVVAHSGDGGDSFDEYAEVADGGELFMHPQLALESGGALDVVYYAGGAADDEAASFRWARAADAIAWEPSTVVLEPVTFWGSNSQAPWLGDYEGLTWSRGALFAAFVDNSSGAAHIAFWRTPTGQ